MKKLHKERGLIEFPYGKWKVHYMKDVPTDYLLWCIKNYTDESLKLCITEEVLHGIDIDAS